jgi:predicted negative regulator of RcsB-dependent stress response
METTQSSSFLDQISKIKRELFIGVILIALGGLGFAIYSHLEERKEYNASKDYFAITQTWKNKEQPSENLKEEANRTAVEAFIEKNKNTSMAMSAAILLADFYSQEKNEAKAAEILAKNTLASVSSFVEALYLYRKSVSLERTGKCDLAIKELDTLISTKTTQFLQAEARLQKALCLEQVGKKDEAKAEYEQISKNFADTEAGKNAKKYLRLLDTGA